MGEEEHQSCKAPRRGTLTSKQRKFAAAYLSSGNASASARLAGYADRSSNQLAVQGSRNLRHPGIRLLIATALEAEGCTVGRAAHALADALSATKRKIFCEKGELVYGDAEPDHGIRLQAAEMTIRFHTASASGGDGAAPDGDRQLTPEDRRLLEQAAAIEGELRELKGEGNEATNGSE